MSRIRSVHPGFFTDEELVSTSLGARLLFIGIGIEADDKGVFEWKPLTIKMRVFPADNLDVSELLAELVAAGAVQKYEMDGRQYGAIRNFRKFQRPKTPNDIHPAPADIRNYVGLTDPISEPFLPKGEKSPQMEDGGGKREEEEEEEKKEEVEPAQARATRLQHDFTVPSEWLDWADTERGWSRGDTKIEAASFVDHWSAKSGKDATKLDWFATWRNWIRNSRRISSSNGSAFIGQLSVPC